MLPRRRSPRVRTVSSLMLIGFAHGTTISHQSITHINRLLGGTNHKRRVSA